MFQYNDMAEGRVASVWHHYYNVTFTLVYIHTHALYLAVRVYIYSYEIRIIFLFILKNNPEQLVPHHGVANVVVH